MASQSECERCLENYVVIFTRSVTNLGHQGGEKFSERAQIL